MKKKCGPPFKVALFLSYCILIFPSELLSDRTFFLLAALCGPPFKVALRLSCFCGPSFKVALCLSYLIIFFLYELLSDRTFFLLSALCGPPFKVALRFSHSYPTFPVLRASSLTVVLLYPFCSIRTAARSYFLLTFSAVRSSVQSSPTFILLHPTFAVLRSK